MRSTLVPIQTTSRAIQSAANHAAMRAKGLGARRAASRAPSTIAAWSQYEPVKAHGNPAKRSQKRPEAQSRSCTVNPRSKLTGIALEKRAEAANAPEKKAGKPSMTQSAATLT